MIKDKLMEFKLDGMFSDNELNKLQNIADELALFIPEEDMEYQLLNLIAVMNEMRE